MPAAALPPDNAAVSRVNADSAFDASSIEKSLQDGRADRWLNWRRRAMVLLALVGCVGVLALARWVASTPHIDALWSSDEQGRLVLQHSAVPALRAHIGQVVVAVGVTGKPAEQAQAVDGLLLQHSPRWQVDGSVRQRQMGQQRAVHAALASRQIALHLDDGGVVNLPTSALGYAGVGWLFWPLAGLSLLLYLFGVVVVLARPRARNLLYLVMAWCQSANLLCMALETVPGLAQPTLAIGFSPGLRLALDVATVAAIAHSCALHPLRMAYARAVAAGAWLGGALGVGLLIALQPASIWWWSQALCLGLGTLALALVHRACRLQPNPYALVMRRLCALAVATLVLVSMAVALAARMPNMATGVAAGATLAWYLFLASLLLLVPFLSRSRQVLREFALLAGISTVATSVDLLFVSVFSVGPFTSLAVAVFVGVAIYAGARHAILHNMLGVNMLTTERIFEHLYRAAREVQSHPQQFSRVLGRLLSELFEPLEVQTLARVPANSLVVGGGAALVVPVRDIDDNGTPATAWALRYAQRGQRLFTHEDARLADRVAEQLRRAVAYDLAVERGRYEERQRIAQDLHDDIGARLLTLMYQAPTPELEDYIRHTLQDLKTLTRGLAAAEHRLSHAAAEWKADLHQRLTAAQVRLEWACSYSHDMSLSVVQWSALTRLLRELVSNSLYHGHASCIEVSMRFEPTGLTLAVADDGVGHNPQAWAHGLGLGGVRKRVKLLGGEVSWRENQPRGIVCEAHMADIAAPA